MGKNVIIIGGTSGIGLATAHYLKQQGYKVFIGGRSKPKVLNDLIYKKIDVTNEKSIKFFFNSLPKIDSLVYCAGVVIKKNNVIKFDIKKYKQIHDVNLLGAILILKHSYPFLKKSHGRVVIVNSYASRTYSKYSGFEYTVTKSGLSGLVKQLSIEWAKNNILINSIFPSMVNTPMLLNNLSKKEFSLIEKSIPLGRIAKVGDITPVIEFLISTKNNYITGAGIDINGGQYLTS